MKLLIARIICLGIICLTFHNTYSQVPLPGTIEDIFNKEFSKNKESNNELCFITPAVALPDWFFNQPQADQDTFYAVGISDPWVVRDKGKTQAKIRAFCLAGFMNNVSANGVSDVYNEINQRYKFEQLSRFHALPNAGLQGVLIDSFVTKYQEQVILYKFTPGKTKRKNNSLIEYYKSGIKQDEGYSKLEKIELYNQTDNEIMRYEYRVNNTDFEIISVLNSDTTTVKPTIYQYVEGKNTTNSDTIAEISLFKKGLWQGFLKSLIDNLDMAASDLASKQKSVSQISQDEKGTKGFNQLNRGIYNVSFSFSISAIEIANNELIIHFKTNKKL